MTHDFDKLADLIDNAEFVSPIIDSDMTRATATVVAIAYSEHICQKTIDEAIACVPKTGKVYEMFPLANEDMVWAYEEAIGETITNLEKLK